MVNSKTEANKPDYIKFFTSTSLRNTLLLLGFALVFTLLLASKHFFFRSLIDENNIARHDVYAEKTIEVVDTFKTEQRRKELAQKLDPVMRPAEDMFILNDFDNLIVSMYQIKSSEGTFSEKNARLIAIFDHTDD